MSDTNTVVVGDKGRIVLPAAIRQSRGWTTDTVLLVLETESGVELLTRDELLKRVRKSLDNSGDLVGELIAERRAEAARENAE
jgi:AbrB family looped-hinge helix DNA binding protein